MRNLKVIVPTRSRPKSAARLLEAFKTTTTDDTGVVFAVDADDPSLEQYLKLDIRPQDKVMVRDTHTMVEALNRAALELAAGCFALGFMGDDHLPRTHGWDSTFLEKLEKQGVGLCYGNDLLQGKNLPTQVVMTANIVTILGQMAPPSLSHLYVDNYWLQLGYETGAITYFPDVVIEHLHPAAGKATSDDGYSRVNAYDTPDKAAWAEYKVRNWLERDASKLGLLQKMVAAQ